ncbi:MAG: TolC family protein [Moheibacter sp.]
MKNLKYVGILAAILLLQSCFVAKDYTRPAEVVNENFYRTDALPEDSLSLANVSWQEIFTDEKLAGYIETGLANNLDIRIALQNISAAEAYVKMGRSGYFPTLNGSAAYSHSTQSLHTPLGSLGGNERQYVNQYEIGGNLSWEADIWGKIRSNDRAFRANYLQSVAAHQAVKSELVAAIASTYFQLLAYDEQRRITTETIANREQGLETMVLLKDAGNVTEVAVKQTEAQLLNAQALLLDIENNIKLLENTFSILLGENPKSIDRNEFAAQEIRIDLNAGVPVQLLANRPDVMAAEYGLINAFELTNVARSQFYPSLRLTANGGIQSIDFEDLFSVNSLFASIVGSLTQPILNGRQIRTEYEVSQARQEAAFLNYKKTILLASKEVSDALYTYRTNEEKIQLKQGEYEAYRQAIVYSEELQAYGMANYLEVLTARENALNAQLNLIMTQYGRLNAVVQLYRALGGGWR